MINDDFDQLQIINLAVDQPLVASGLVWLSVHGAMCMALRHPLNVGPSRALMLEFVRELGSRLVEWGCLTPEQLEAAAKTDIEESPHADGERYGEAESDGKVSQG